MANKARVVIVGAGFGGLAAAKALASSPDAQVTLVDRNNYNTFFPLIYQVAAAELSAEETTNPVRSIIRKLRNVSFHMDDIKRVDLNRRVLEGDKGEIPYDYLILAPGSSPLYFGIPGADTRAFPLRTLEDGVWLRNHILACFEEASVETDPERRRRLLTFVIVGGGPTGVEFTGSLAELVYGPLKKDFPGLDRREIQIVEVEGQPRLLPMLPEKLSHYAEERLRRKGVETRCGEIVAEISSDELRLKSGNTIPTRTVVWTAGHRGHPLAEASGLPVNRRGQVTAAHTLQVPEHPNIYVVGDIASIEVEGNPVPMVAPAAIQQGEQAARNILRQLAGRQPEPFRYKEKGMMVVVGRNAAVANLNKFSFKGFFAWILWLGVHIYQLIGFRNRLEVLVKWGWDYIFYERAVRLILPSRRQREPEQAPVEAAAREPAQQRR